MVAHTFNPRQITEFETTLFYTSNTKAGKNNIVRQCLKQTHGRLSISWCQCTYFQGPSPISVVVSSDCIQNWDTWFELYFLLTPPFFPLVEHTQIIISENLWTRQTDFFACYKNILISLLQFSIVKTKTHSYKPRRYYFLIYLLLLGKHQSNLLLFQQYRKKPYIFLCALFGILS